MRECHQPQSSSSPLILAAKKKKRPFSLQSIFVSSLPSNLAVGQESSPMLELTVRIFSSTESRKLADHARGLWSDFPFRNGLVRVLSYEEFLNYSGSSFIAGNSFQA